MPPVFRFHSLTYPWPSRGIMLLALIQVQPRHSLRRHVSLGISWHDLKCEAQETSKDNELPSSKSKDIGLMVIVQTTIGGKKPLGFEGMRIRVNILVVCHRPSTSSASWTTVANSGISHQILAMTYASDCKP